MWGQRIKLAFGGKRRRDRINLLKKLIYFVELFTNEDDNHLFFPLMLWWTLIYRLMHPFSLSLLQLILSYTVLTFTFSAFLHVFYLKLPFKRCAANLQSITKKIFFHYKLSNTVISYKLKIFFEKWHALIYFNWSSKCLNSLFLNDFKSLFYVELSSPVKQIQFSSDIGTKSKKLGGCL